jgi:hypothetical protein
MHGGGGYGPGDMLCTTTGLGGGYDRVACFSNLPTKVSKLNEYSQFRYEISGLLDAPLIVCIWSHAFTHTSINLAGGLGFVAST